MISMPVWVLVLLIIACLIVLGAVWAMLTAGRLNRLHIRTDSARIALEGALHARTALIGALQPELKLAADGVQRVPLQAIDMSAHSEAENALLARLDDTLTENPAFREASARVDLASRFYNDAVWDTRQLRSRLSIRAFRLAGYAPLPEYYEAATAGHVE